MIEDELFKPNFNEIMHFIFSMVYMLTHIFCYCFSNSKIYIKEFLINVIS